jgi:hypothetical protein
MNHTLASLGHDEAIDLLICYDTYIQRANDENKYVGGWYPVCIAEYYESEEYANDLAARYPGSQLTIKELDESAFVFYNGDGPYCAVCAQDLIETEGADPENYEIVHYSLLGSGTGFMCDTYFDIIPR